MPIFSAGLVPRRVHGLASILARFRGRGAARMAAGGAWVICMAAGAQADPGGDRSLSLIFDGTEQVFAARMDGARTGFTRFLSVDAVSLEGANGPARLVLELSVDGTRGDQPNDARILYLPDGWRDYWVSPLVFPTGGVVIDHLDLSGPAPRIAGSFAVPLCFTPGPAHRPDPDRCLPASGQFATPLARD